MCQIPVPGERLNMLQESTVLHLLVYICVLIIEEEEEKKAKSNEISTVSSLSIAFDNQ